ncbi:hypothetical protein BU16DRAFT_326446 [Lophium mytilinum]|uniref:Uncharacterized protein n=1 Tax=Lophium mytilinum TaxID=390894 RepID=A0A6A6QZY4_9PEZI|nr:hypothetical protein BU16DRAFT_326446 [Lophium mytilinum]
MAVPEPEEHAGKLSLEEEESNFGSEDEFTGSEDSGDQESDPESEEPTLITQEFRKDGLVWKSSNKADPERFSFLDFPRELRNEVYQASLVRGEVCRSSWSHDGAGARFNFYPSDDPPNFTLFAVCQQVRAEAQESYYGATTFVQEGGALDDFRVGLLEDPNTRDDHRTIFWNFHDPFACACVIVTDPYSTLVRHLKLSLNWSCCGDGLPAKATKKAVAVISDAFPAIKQVEFKLWCDELRGHPSMTTVDPTKLSLERAITILSNALGLDSVLPKWFKLVFALYHGHHSQEWMVVWEELRKSGKFANV